MRGAGSQENVAPGVTGDMSSKLAIPAERKDRAAATVLPLPEPANPQQADSGSVQNSPVRKIRYDMLQQHHDAAGGDEVLLDDAMKTPLKRPPSLPTPVSLVGAQLNFWVKGGSCTLHVRPQPMRLDGSCGVGA